MGLRGRADDAAAPVAGLFIFEDGRAGTVGEDHGVPVIHVDHPGQGLGADHQRFLHEPGFEEGIGLDHALQPAGASEENVIGHAGRIADPELVLHPARQRGHGIALYGMFHHVPEIVREDDLIQGFRIHAAVLDGLAGSGHGHARAVQLRRGITPLPDTRDGLELVHHLQRRPVDPVMVLIIECIDRKVKVGFYFGRYI